MKNLILTILIVGGGGYLGAKFYLHYEVSNGLDQALLMASPFVDIQYDGVSSTMSGELSIDGVTARVNQFSDPLYIEKLSIITPGFFWLLNIDSLAEQGTDFEMPEKFGLKVTGLIFCPARVAISCAIDTLA